MELYPLCGWEAFDRSPAILDLLWSQLVAEHWHYYNFTSDTCCWECRHESANRVCIEFRGEAVHRLVIEQDDDPLADSSWLRGLGGLASLLVVEFAMIVRPNAEPNAAPDRLYE